MNELDLSLISYFCAADQVNNDAIKWHLINMNEYPDHLSTDTANQ